MEVLPLEVEASFLTTAITGKEHEEIYNIILIALQKVQSNTFDTGYDLGYNDGHEAGYEIACNQLKENKE